MLLLNESCSLNTALERCTSICSFVYLQYLWGHLAKRLMIADVRIALRMLRCWSASEMLVASFSLFSPCKQKSCCVALPHVEEYLIYCVDPSSYHRSGNVAALLVRTSEVPAAGCSLKSKALCNYFCLWILDLKDCECRCWARRHEQGSSLMPNLNGGTSRATKTVVGLT